MQLKLEIDIQKKSMVTCGSHIPEEEVALVVELGFKSGLIDVDTTVVDLGSGDGLGSGGGGGGGVGEGLGF